MALISAGLNWDILIDNVLPRCLAELTSYPSRKDPPLCSVSVWVGFGEREKRRDRGQLIAAVHHYSNGLVFKFPYAHLSISIHYNNGKFIVFKIYSFCS